VNLAIIRKSLIAQWMNAFSDAGISVKKILPEVLALPFDENETNTVSGIEVANGWLIREGNWQGTFLDKDWLALYFQQAIAKLDEEQNGIVFKHHSELPTSFVEEMSAFEGFTLDAAEPELAMLLLAKGADRVSWNLLQGELAPKKAVNKTWQTWRPAALLTVVVLVLQFVVMIINWQQAERELAVAKAQLVEEYQQAFPKEKVRVNLLRRQLTRKVVEATGGSSMIESAGFLQVMNRVAEVLTQHKDISSDSVRFDGKRNELRLNVVAPSFQKFEMFKSALEKQGMEVQQGAVNNEGEQVAGSLNIKEAS
jgi:general secretion pathway protein L